MTTPDETTTDRVDTQPDGVAKGAGPEEIKADIERTRAELGQTVEALSSKLDVKAQARRMAADGKVRANELATRVQASATDRQGKPVATVWFGLGGMLVAGAAVAVLLAWKRRR
ncbi:DUF3618 domain-containing protein [Arthrobacter pigmenti]